MPPKKRPVLSKEEKERIAAQLLAASEGWISTALAMQTVGFKSPERDEKTKKRVYRKAQKIQCVGGHDDTTAMWGSSASTSTPSQLVMEPNPRSQDHSISSLSAPPSNLPSTSTNRGHAGEGEGDTSELRRQLTVDTDSPPPKKCRWSPVQKHMDMAEKNKKRKQQAAAVKLATQQIEATKAMSPKNPNKKSQRRIVEELNKRLGTNVSHKTVSRMVLEGKIGVSPRKPGPAGSFNKTEYDAMKIAFLTYIKIKQSIGKKQSTIKDMSLRVNALINYSGKFQRKSDDLAKRLKKDVADEIDVKMSDYKSRLVMVE